MTIEYLPGLKAGDKIDLNALSSSRFDKKKDRRPESFISALDKGLAQMSHRLNSEYGELFSDTGQIALTGAPGSDDKMIEEKEALWASEQKKSLTQWRSDREKSAPAICEKALTLLFDQVLRQEFIVVRASTYDDYKNGADQLIIDKETGAVICGLDDVLGHEGDDGGAKKAALLAKRMATGGAMIKYGLATSARGLERQSFSNVPLFYFSLSKEELGELLVYLESGAIELNGPVKEIYKKLVQSLTLQAQNYLESPAVTGSLATNISNLQPSLERMLNK